MAIGQGPALLADRLADDTDDIGGDGHDDALDLLCLQAVLFAQSQKRADVGVDHVGHREGLV